jgi:hypothetical protein
MLEIEEREKEMMTEWILKILIETTKNRKIRKKGGHKMNQ